MSALAYKFPEEEHQITTEASIPQVLPRAIQSQPVSTPLLQREADSISPIAIVGFAVACVLVVCVLFSHIQLDLINNETTTLTSQLSSLQDEYEDLSAQYQQMFDMEAIKSDMLTTGAMSDITSQQQIYMDLSQPDTSTTDLGGSDSDNLLTTILDALSDLIP